MQVKKKKEIKQRPCGFTQSQYKEETIKEQKLKKKPLAYKSGNKGL